MCYSNYRDMKWYGITNTACTNEMFKNPKRKIKREIKQCTKQSLPCHWQSTSHSIRSLLYQKPALAVSKKCVA